jgi:hypothetical protein
MTYYVMKEHEMKRTIVLLATLLLSFGLISAQSDIVTVSHVGDTIWTGSSSTFDVSLENSQLLGGMSLGLQISSPDGATWAWDAAGTHGTSLYVTEVAGTRMIGAWDMTGLLITEEDVDGNLPDVIMAGGVALMVGMAAGPSEHMYSLHGITGPDDLTVRTICVDSIKVGEAGNFVFVDGVGGAYTPDYVSGLGGSKCWPVVKQPNIPPAYDPMVGAANVDHCGSATIGFSASDVETNVISHTEYSNSGAGAVIINGNDTSGDVTYTPAAGEAGVVVVEVMATDAFNAMGGIFTATFTITNNAPTLDCGLPLLKVGKGGEITKNDITSSDADACDVLTYAISSQSEATVNAPSFDGVDFVWLSDESEKDKTIQFCVTVTDGFETVECCFEVEVLATEPYALTIECAEDVIQGHFTDIDITVDAGSEQMGGFDLLIAYDPSGLTFTEATLGSAFADAGWEFFTYRYGAHGNCGNGCPSGNIRLVGMAETNNGPYHPDGDAITAAQTGSTLATLSFFVTSDVNFGGQCLAINFLWFDCGDNTISVASGDTLAIADLVFPAGANTDDPTQAFDAGSAMFPGMWGAPAECDVSDKTEPVRYITLQNGCLCIIHPDDIDGRGDINMNGVLNEIADAVMFTNYFISGLSAFGSHVDASIAASDVNADGTSLSVADLVYLVRVIIGDASPYAKPLPGSGMDVSAQMVNGELVVSYDATVDAGAVLMVFDITGQAGTPVVGDGASNMDLVYGVDNNQLRVLVYNIGSNAISAGEHTLVTIPVQNAELVSVEVADFNGATMDATFNTLPSTFGLMQNYPNPFNPSTKISLNLPAASDWTIQVYNIAGQLVRDYTGNSEAGVVIVEWDGTDMSNAQVASGIYFYKATANNFSATKKMVLMK